MAKETPATRAANKIMSLLDAETSVLSTEDYREVLDEVSSQVETRLEALDEEAR